MILKNIQINNFYSYKSVYFDFTKYASGVINIFGINKDTGGSNGAGKSILLEAITFALFNKTIRKSTEEALVNVYEGSNCCVRLELEQEGLGEVIIERRKRPTGLDVWLNGESLVKENQAKTQEYLEEILDINYKSFCASVVFGQHSDVDFLSSSKEDKRLIIKNCLNLDTIFEYRARIKEIKSECMGEFKAVDMLCSELIKQLKEIEDKNPDKKQYKYIEIPPLLDILAAEDEIRKNEKKIEANLKEIDKYEERVHKLEDIVVNGVYSENKECPVCKSKYLKTQTAKDVEAAEIDLHFVKGQMDDCLSEIRVLNIKNEELKPKISSSLWNKYNEKNKLCENAKVINEQIESLKQRIQINNERRNALDRRIEILKYWEKAFSEQGLLKYIIKNILDYLNLQVNKYISILTNNQFSILFDEELNETICTNNKIISYISLSGGEKRKINLAVMLGLQSIQTLINKNNVNMIFFDEICENIDVPEGVNGIYNLLNLYKEEGKLIFLITHNEYLRGLLDSYQSITIIKARGVSSLKEE